MSCNKKAIDETRDDKKFDSEKSACKNAPSKMSDREKLQSRNLTAKIVAVINSTKKKQRHKFRFEL